MKLVEAKSCIPVCSLFVTSDIFYFNEFTFMKLIKLIMIFYFVVNFLRCFTNFIFVRIIYEFPCYLESFIFICTVNDKV